MKKIQYFKDCKRKYKKPSLRKIEKVRTITQGLPGINLDSGGLAGFPPNESS